MGEKNAVGGLVLLQVGPADGDGLDGLAHRLGPQRLQLARLAAPDAVGDGPGGGLGVGGPGDLELRRLLLVELVLMGVHRVQMHRSPKSNSWEMKHNPK